jgi:hypothetical protein
MTTPTPLPPAGNFSQPSTAPFDLATENPAVAHCMEIFHRTHRAELAKGTDRIFAIERAGKAYRRAMPALTDANSAVNFIACTAHGVLIGAIQPRESTALLYAVQVALSYLRRLQPGTERAA